MGLARWWHFTFDLLWVINGLIYYVLPFTSDPWQMVVPTIWSVFPSALSTALQYLSLQFPAIASVEKEAEAVMIPAVIFRDWVKRYDPWREFVFDLLSERLSTVMAVVEEVVFQRMDQRVASWLLSRSQVSNPIQTTHQATAAELGSSREVISRLLEDFSQKGWVEVGRGTVEILDMDELLSCAVM